MTRNPPNRTAATFGRVVVWILLILLVTGAAGPLSATAFADDDPGLLERGWDATQSGAASAFDAASGFALDTLGRASGVFERAMPSGTEAAAGCFGGVVACASGVGLWTAGRVAGAVGDASQEAQTMRSLEPGPDGCWRPWQYHREELTAGLKYSQPGCERNLLPAWRWQSAATDLTNDFGRFGAVDSALHVLSRTSLLFAGFLWSILLSVLEWGLTADLALHSHELVNGLYLVVSESVTTSALVPIFVLLIVVSIARSALRSDTRRVVTAVVAAGLFLGAIHALAERAAEEPTGSFSLCDRLSGERRDTCNEQLSERFASPATGSPGWFAWQGVTLADTVAHEFVEPFTQTDGFLTFHGAHRPTSRSDISCAAYVDGMYDLHARYTGLEDTSALSAFGTRDSEGMLRLASRLWESGFLTYWKIAQFGAGSDAGEDVSCFLLETNARVHPEEQWVFAVSAWELPAGQAPAVEVFEVQRRTLLGGARTDRDTTAKLFAWSSCGVELVGDGEVRFSDNAIWEGAEGCETWWSSGTAPASADVDRDRLTSAQVELDQMLDAWSGTNHADRLFSGFFAVVVALIYLWTFGAMALGSLAAQVGIIVMLMLLPVTFLLLALPRSPSRPRSDSAGMRMLRLTGSMFLAKLVLTVMLAMTFVVTGLIQNLFTSGLATSTAGGPFATTLPLAFTGQATLRSLLISAAPLISLFLIRKLFKTLGFNSITSLSGALTFPLAAASKVAGDQKSVEKIQQSVPQFGKAAKKWVGRGATVAGAAALGTGLVGAGIASTDPGKRSLARVTAGTRESASELFHALNDPSSKLGSFRQSLASMGSMATMFGSGRARQAGFKLMAANKLVEPGGLLDTIGISRNQLGQRVPLDDTTMSRTIESSNPNEQAGETGTSQGELLRTRLATHDNPEDRQDMFEEILAADARSRTTSWNPAAFTPEERERLHAAAASKLGLPPEAAAHMHIAANGKATFDPTQDWEQLGAPKIAQLASVAAATATTKTGEPTPVAQALLDRWDPENINNLQRYVETTELVTHAAGGAVRDLTGRLEIRSVEPGGLELHKIDDRTLRDITRYVDANADTRAQHQAMAIQVMQARVDRNASQVAASTTADGSPLQLAAAQQQMELFDQFADQVSGLVASTAGPDGRDTAIEVIRAQGMVRVQHALKELAEAKHVTGTAIGVQAMHDGNRLEEVRRLEHDIEQTIRTLTQDVEQHLAAAARHVADGNTPDVQMELRSVSRLIEKEVESARITAQREVSQMNAAVAATRAEVREMEYDYPQASSRQPAVAAGELRASMNASKAVEARIDSMVVDAPPSTRNRRRSGTYSDVTYSL